MNNVTSNGVRLRKGDMAARLSISVRCLENWMTNRIVPFIKVGNVVLFDPIEVDTALNRFISNTR